MTNNTQSKTNLFKIEGTFEGIEKQGDKFISFYVGFHKPAWRDKPEELHKIQVTAFKNLMPMVQVLNKGDFIWVEGKVNAREYNGKHFASLSCTDVILTGKSTTAVTSPNIDTDDLPF